jgi:hypothetical protein
MVQIDLKDRFPSMTPVKSAPSLFRINGFGVAMHGRRDADADTGTYISTWCLTLLFVPILCLRAYRVANAERGWYFLGREPLSIVAKAWNLFLMLAVAGLVGAGAYTAYTSTAAYKAEHQMALARELVEQGRLGQAATIYQRLASAGADQAQNATAALGELLDKQCQQAPLSECAGVFAAAARISRRDGAVGPDKLVGQGLALVGAKGDSDPRGGVALLNALAPLTVDTRRIDEPRLPLLRKWVAAEPANLDALCGLAALLEQQNQLDEAKALLLPVKARLGEGEGARVLGTILAHQGDYDGAYALLWPYVKTRLDKLHAAEKAYNDTERNLWDQQLARLNAHKAPTDFYSRYDRAGKEAQRAMVQEYVNSQIKDDPRYVEAQETLHREAAVVPVTLDLGIVMLQRAQGQPNPDLRKTQLESAEKVFLAIGGFAGQSDEYRLSLGQVYYWLGKQTEGRKLFDDFLAAKGRSSDALLAIAVKLRQLGAVPEARAMAEEAYAQGKDDENRQAAAVFRAECQKDSDDQIAWLNKGNTANPTIKAKLANALGEKAISEGRDDEATAQFHIAIEAYAAMPHTAVSLNDAACAWYAIFSITGDRQALDRCYDNYQQAVDLSPSNPILLGNAADTLVAAALGDVIGSEIDLRALHEMGGFHLLGYLYQDQTGRAAVIKRVKDHPGIARALSYYDKLMVLSPKSTNAYAFAYQIHQFTRNEPALEALAQRVQAATFDTADALTQANEFISGVKDNQAKVESAAVLKRVQDAVGRLRAKGGRTLSVALDQQCEAMITQDMLQGGIDPEKVIALAEEAQQACPSANTTGDLVAAYLFRATRNLCQSDPAFAAFHAKYRRSLGGSYLLVAAAGEAGPLQQAVLQNVDARKAMALLREQNKLFLESPTAYEWALLKNAEPAEAGKMAEIIKKNPRWLVEQSIMVCLYPASAAEALEASWVLQICGKPAEAGAALRKVADLGIPVPGQP